MTDVPVHIGDCEPGESALKPPDASAPKQDVRAFYRARSVAYILAWMAGEDAGRRFRALECAYGRAIVPRTGRGSESDTWGT